MNIINETTSNHFQLFQNKAGSSIAVGKRVSHTAPEEPVSHPNQPRHSFFIILAIFPDVPPSPPHDWCGTPRLRSVRTRPIGRRVEIPWCVAVDLTGYWQIAVAWHWDAVHCVEGLIVHGLAVWPAAGEFGEIGQKRSEDAAGSRCYTVRSPHVVRAWNTNGHKVAIKRATSMGLWEVNISVLWALHHHTLPSSRWQYQYNTGAVGAWGPMWTISTPCLFQTPSR